MEGRRKTEGRWLQPQLQGAKDPHFSLGRSKRDAKQATERLSTGNTDGIQVVAIQDSKRCKRTQDTVPVEDSLQETDGKTEHETSQKCCDPKFQESSKPAHIPNAGSYFQHDDRSAEPNSRNVRRRFSDHGSWSETTMGRPSDRYRDRVDHADALGRGNNRGQVLRKEEGGDRVWRHDRFFELEANEPQERRKPAFRETKVVSRVVGSGSKSILANDKEDGYNKTLDSIRREGRGDASERKFEAERGSEIFFEIERKDKDRDHAQRNNDLERGRWLERDQYNDEFQNRGRFSSISRGRERMGRRFNGSIRNQLRSHAFTGEKWKHDLFDEANRSPTPKNEEEQIAKIESLLAG